MNPQSAAGGGRRSEHARYASRSGRRSRLAILEAAEQLLAERGMQGSALAQIEKRARVAVGTLY